ncbi:MAG: DUF1801 domain-containing protein [Cytophagales bacterium]|nr:DUF1801 domain-containing protein [Cytophagales bacterium]
MAELKTTPNAGDVEAFLSSVEDETKRDDCYAILKMMEEITGEPPKMWGGTIVGFGSYNYKYESGRTGTWFLTGFSPRKQNLTMYLMPGAESLEDLFKGLGKYKIGKGCLYVKKLEQIDQDVLRKLIQGSVDKLKEMYKEYN